ncbi:MAG TPA: response regulator transcription factor [Ramlibacter sp.]|nr:response regulator transcription factor [Ramlibacter sp.]
MSIKLLVSCREELLALGLLASVVEAADGSITGEAAQIGDVLSKAAATTPDVLLLEYTQDIAQGELQLLSQVAQVSSRTRILLLCESHADGSIIGYIRHGARGCLLLSSEPAIHAKAVHAVHQGETWFGRSELLQALRSQIVADPNGASGTLNDQELLTPREREILALIGIAMSNKEIARQLKISDHTVKTHLHHIYVKLEKSGRYKAFLSSPVAGTLPRIATPLELQQSLIRSRLRKQAPADLERGH